MPGRRRLRSIMTELKVLCLLGGEIIPPIVSYILTFYLLFPEISSCYNVGLLSYFFVNQHYGRRVKLVNLVIAELAS